MAPNQYDKALVWFRRDLRDYDHAALYHALSAARQVYCVFVFDSEILDRLKNKADRRVEFIWLAVSELKTALQKQGGDLTVIHGRASDEIPKLASQLQVDAVFCNHDFEPAAIARDAKVAARLQEENRAFHHYKDQVIFEKNEVLTQTGKPYGVFTPYKNAWLKTIQDGHLQPYPVDSQIKTSRKLASLAPSPA